MTKTVKLEDKLEGLAYEVENGYCPLLWALRHAAAYALEDAANEIAGWPSQSRRRIADLLRARAEEVRRGE